jgi:hypothetical protein
MNDDFDEEVAGPNSEEQGVTLDDFVAYMPTHTFIFTPCREPWAAASINARLPRIIVRDDKGLPKHDNRGKIISIAPTTWLAQNRPVEQMTWCPGLPILIPDRLVVDGGWIERKRTNSFNLYRPPRLVLGDASQAKRWIEHFHTIYPHDAPHCIQWLAHRVQRPAEKINHAIVLGGDQGIGKDTLLEPVSTQLGIGISRRLVQPSSLAASMPLSVR